MDSEQKVCASSWMLLSELVKQYRKAETEAAASGGVAPLPAISYYKARQIMTRADFLESGLLHFPPSTPYLYI